MPTDNIDYRRMTERLRHIKQLISNGQTEEAIVLLNGLLSEQTEAADDVHYLLGNAFRKQGDWQGALNHYQEAITINPESPAKEARNMALDILNFYNKDMYNQ